MSNSKPLITHKVNLNEAWEKILSLFDTALEEHHPFRYLSFATVNKQHEPEQRMVVLREFDGDSLFTFFTDARSKKVDQIRENDSVDMLFYHSEKQLQVTVTGRASVLTEGSEKQNYWQESGSKGAHSYTSLKPPGQVIENPGDAYEWELDDPEYFCVVKVHATKMTFLQLDGNRHLRSVRTQKKGDWKLNWIAP